MKLKLVTSEGLINVKNNTTLSVVATYNWRKPITIAIKLVNLKKTNSRRVLFLALHVLMQSNCFINAQNFSWARVFQGLFDDLVSEVVTDSFGNVYAVGLFKTSGCDYINSKKKQLFRI